VGWDVRFDTESGLAWPRHQKTCFKKLKMFNLSILSRCAPARASLAAVATKSLSGCG
jgi:hypothetical protein